MFEFLINLFTKDNKNRESIGKTAGVFGILCNVILCVLKMAVGLLFKSVSVVADAFNNLSDALTSVITVVSFKLSGKPADEDHPYGHERIEYVVTLILAFLIIFIGYELIRTSIGRIFSPAETEFGLLMAIVLVISVLGKLFMNRMYTAYAKMTDSSVLKATAQDSLNDAISTSAVLICLVVSQLFNLSLDGYVGVCVSLFIIWSGVSLIKEALNPILGSAPDREFTHKVEKEILSYDGVIGIHDLIVHSYGPSKTFASVHAEVDAKGDILESHDMIDNIEREVCKKYGVELVIHMDPIVTDDEETNEAREIIKQIVEGVDLCLTMHDFRMVPGSTHTNLIFDVVVPYDCKVAQKEILKKIQSLSLEKLGDKYFCVVNFDREYTTK
jgi:cation diffusion facilitator family transporter